ncbi:phospholipase D-like domain-containing protein [Micromonospora sp. NPDC005163]
MWNRRHYSGNDYYDSASGRGYYQATAADAYASPEGAGPTDTFVTRLNDLTLDANCRLRVGMASVITGRPQIVDLVTRFRAAGCKVWMVIGTNADGGIAMSQSVYDELLDAGGAIRRKDKVHDKLFVAYGKYGSAYQYRVYTGSQNWTRDALNENDEIFVKMAPESGTAPALRRLLHPLQRRIQLWGDLLEERLPVPILTTGQPASTIGIAGRACGDRTVSMSADASACGLRAATRRQSRSQESVVILYYSEGTVACPLLTGAYSSG